MSESYDTLTWRVLHFEDMTPLQLHDALKVRVDVFVVEQACAYNEIDGKDPFCHHVIGLDSAHRVVATARIAPQGLLYPEASIGRVAILPEYRSFGHGYEIMKRGIEQCKDGFSAPSIKIAAQYHLEKFYSQLGFNTISPQFEWDGIPHVYMLLTLGSNA